MIPTTSHRLRPASLLRDVPGPAWPRGCWPTDTQRLLLRACLLEDEAAVQAAFREWARRVPLFCVDAGSQKLLLCLYERLQVWRLEYADLQRLKGLAKYRWIRHQSLSRELGSILRALHAAGIDTLLLKGAALNLTVYPQGQRLMSDLDVAVRRSQAVAAMRVLAAHGRRPGFPNHERLVETGMECPFGEEARGHLDLHWDFFHGRYLDDAAQRELWDAARPVAAGELHTRVLCPADQLLHVCEHGLRENETPPFRWLADACQILRRSGDQLDWGRLAALAEKYDLLLPVRHTLDYLERHLETAAPAAARRQLDRPRVSRRSRAAYALTARRLPGAHPFWRRLPVNVIDWLRIRRAKPALAWADHLQSVTCLYPSVRQHLPQLLRLQWRAVCIGLAAAVRTPFARLWPGRRRGRLDISQLPDQDLDGCNTLETWDGGLVRWTGPVGAVQLPLPPDTYEITLQLAPLRPWFHDLQASLQVRWNRELIPREQLRFEGWRVSFPIEPSMFMAFERQRLELRCGAWSDADLDDPRQLGVPLSGVEWRVRRPPVPPLRQQLIAIARRVVQRTHDAGRQGRQHMRNFGRRVWAAVARRVVQRTHDAGRQGWQHMRNFGRRAWAAVASKLARMGRGIAARFGPGLQPPQMDAGTIPAYLLTGFHEVENSADGPLRWTTPRAGVYWRVSPGAYRVQLRLACIRPWKRELQQSLEVALNGRVLPRESLQFQNWCVSFDVPPEQLVRWRRQRLELRCDAWSAVQDQDPRRLGLPLLDIQWQPQREAA